MSAFNSLSQGTIIKIIQVLWGILQDTVFNRILISRSLIVPPYLTGQSMVSHSEGKPMLAAVDIGVKKDAGMRGLRSDISVSFFFHFSHA